jgi:hypothetical protein
MRLPLKDQHQFCLDLNLSYSKLQQVYYDKLKSLLQISGVKVMLGDGTLTDSTTFDPEVLVLHFNLLSKFLKEWTSGGTLKSNTDDLRRITCQYSTQIEKYFVSVYFGIQYHALRYYRVNGRVLEIQKEIFDLTRKCNEIRNSIANIGNNIILKELGNMGYGDLGFEDLLERMISDQSISTQLENKTNNLLRQYPDLRKLEIKQEELVAELNDYIIEIYTIDPAMLDYNKLMQGQEGIVVYMDIETVTNKKSNERQAYVNFKNVEMDSQNSINYFLRELTNTIRDTKNAR